jgi:hypothetical protein
MAAASMVFKSWSMDTLASLCGNLTLVNLVLGTNLSPWRMTISLGVRGLGGIMGVMFACGLLDEYGSFLFLPSF